MGQQRARQLGMRWEQAGPELPEEVQERLRRLLAQLLRDVVEAEHAEEELDDE